MGKIASPLFQPLKLNGTADLHDLSRYDVSKEMQARAKHAVSGDQVLWGIPFSIDKVHVIVNKPIEFDVSPTQAPWLCFLHTAEINPSPEMAHVDKTLTAYKKSGQVFESYMNKTAATYILLYEDGTEETFPIRYRHHINTGRPLWGETCFEAVSQNTPFAFSNDDDVPWGLKQHVHRSDPTGSVSSSGSYVNWICAWENPHPDKTIVGLRVESGLGAVVLSAITAGNTKETPIRWLSRKKVLLTLPDELVGNDEIVEDIADNQIAGLNYHSPCMFLDKARARLLRIDMGAVLSVVPRFAYQNHHWKAVDFNTPGSKRKNEFIIEYAAHPQARAYLKNGDIVDLSGLPDNGTSPLKPISPAEQPVVLKVIDSQTKQPVSVRLHIHGECDEYLTPVNRHRIPNGAWFEDYGPELAHAAMHTSTYIDGEATFKLPLGKVYVEVSKGFECKPVHEIVEIDSDTTEITLEIERVLGWREKGWVTADTHVHFLSPVTAHLEGAAEGIHVVNLLASQWGELMTNLGDFDGKTTYHNKEANEDYFVRVGTENRQNVLGHISLLGYQGSMITPLCTGGPDESAIGDPVEILLTEWAQKCRKQKGLVVIPHLPEPRAENAVPIISGLVDAVEMGAHDYIPPVALVNWYRYLSCGYQVPLTAGTDKMSATVAIGSVRGYSKLSADVALSYEAWQDSIRRGNTFVTVGPLIEFSVNGREAGSRIKLGKTGGQVTVIWQAQTVRYQMTGVELIVNGEVVDGTSVGKERGEGYFELNLQRSSWLCILVRGKLADDGEERILAHSSSVMVEVKGSEFFSSADAVSILEQIEGSMAYLDHVGTRAETRRYKEMRLILEQAHRKLHDRLHRLGYGHSHTITHKHH